MDLFKDREMLKNNIEDAGRENEHRKDQIHGLQQEINKKNNELRKNKVSIDSLIKSVSVIEKERDKFSQEASKANSNLMQMVEEVKLKRNLIGELKKENMEFEAKLKQQMNLYETVRSDRNLYSKNLIEAQDEVQELKRKFGIAAN